MSLPEFSIEKKINILFILIFLPVVIVSYFVILSNRDFTNMNNWITQSNNTQKQIHEILTLQQNTEIVSQEYLESHSPSDQHKLDSLSNAVFLQIDSFKNLTADFPDKQKSIDTLRLYVITELEANKFVTQNTAMFNDSKLVRQLEAQNGFINFTKIVKLLNRMEERESIILNQRTKNLETIKEHGDIIFTILIALFFIIIIAFYMLVRNDIKFRIRTENELKEKSEELKSSNNYKDKMFSIIAHDLRNPFQPIVIISEIMTTEYNTLEKKEIKEFGEQLELISKNVMVLLENLLEWSKVQTGKVYFRPDIISAKKISSSVIKNLSVYAEKKNIKLYDGVDDDITVFADNNMLSSILQNLVSNAIKFTPEKGEISINTNVEEKNMLFSVTDTGVGIAKEYIGKIFNTGDHYSTKGTNDEKGSGLGLLLCKEFVEMHGGKIWAESNQIEGTTFYFTIPLAK
jgi:signal transduction histidine kinase